MRKRRRGRLALSVILSLSVLLAWSIAFLVWLFWSDIERLVQSGGGKTASEPIRKSPPEKISEEERKQLEEILKKRQ